MLNLYRLVREGGCGWDEVQGFVIAAESETQAREIASSRAEDEGRIVWQTAPCELIGTTGSLPEGVVLKASQPA